MDNKRKGSSPPASGDDEPGWREPVPREPSPFEFTDDDDEGSPLPTPPDFDNRRENVPDLLEGDLADDDVATAEELETEEPELLEGSIIMEVPRTHRVPPPIPAPVPLAPGRPSVFIDDGEIALPPRISQGPQSFPFRQLRRDPPSGLFQAPPEPSPTSSNWRSAALRQDHAPEEEEAEEVEADEIVDEPAPPPPRRAAPSPTSSTSPPEPAPSAAPAAPVFAFDDDDDDDDSSAGVTPEPSRYRDPASMFADAEAQATLTDEPVPAYEEASSVLAAPQDNPATGVFGLPADDDDDQLPAEATPYRDEDAAATRDHVMPRPPQPSAAIPVAAIDDDDDDDTAWTVPAATRPSAEPPPVSDDDESAPPAPTDDDDTAWSPPATAELTTDDVAATETWSAPAAIAADDAVWPSPATPPASDDVWPAPPVADDAAIPPVTDDDDAPVPAAAPITDDDDWSQVAAPVTEPPPVTDDDEWTPPVAATPADDEAAAPETPLQPATDDEWTPAAPVTADEEWAPATPAIAATVTADDEWTPAPPATTATVTDDDEWTPAPPASRAADDVPTRHQPALSGAIMVADNGDDDDEWVPQPPATQPAPAPVAAVAPARADDDDEWEPQSAAVALAPVPTDLGEAFPLDLWSDPDELVGRDLGRYRLIKPLSRGMVTRVYAGEVLADERFVAIRVLAPTYSPAEPRARQFLHEAQQLTKLRGENLVEVLEAGSTPDHLSYYAMELLDGDTLAAVIRAEGPLPWSDVAAYANQICDALIVASASGVIHSDLTPATCIRLRPPADEPPPAEGEERRREKIKLLGVGITPLLSVFRGAEGALSVSQGTPPGTAEYMAPEIASGGHPDVHTEIYALGVIMYELLTGRPPFRGDSFLAVLKKQMYDEPVAPHLVVPEQEIPEAFEKVVLKALAKAPADRFADLRALDEALLAARAREGELRRVTQILALDPTDWDEEGSRNSAILRPPSAPARAAAEPIPLATFAADLKEKNPELAAKVFDRPKPSEPSRPVSPPSATPTIVPQQPTQQLTQLAQPVTAPPPVIQPPAPYILQLPQQNSNGFRNISIIIIAVCFLGLIFMWATDRRNSGKTRPDVAAENKKTTAPKKKTSKPTPVDPPAKKTPAKVVPDPPPVKQIEPPAKQVEPPPTKQVEPPVEPPPTKQVEPPPTKQVEPPPVEPPPTKKPDPPPTKKPDDGRPERLDANKIKAKVAALDAKAKAACAAKSGMKDPKGIRVIFKVVVSPKGVAKATATGAWAGTPLGMCIEQTVGPALHFGETRTGGSYKHTINF